MIIRSTSSLLLAAIIAPLQVEGFIVHHPTTTTQVVRRMADDDGTATKSDGGDNKAMAFLRKIGKVGGANNQDFINSMGVDEGPAGKSMGSGENSGKPVRKAKAAYTSCVDSGIIDDLSESFPMTSSGTQWTGRSDRLRGGVSSGTVTREAEDVEGRTANVLRGKVQQSQNSDRGGIIQMATDLSLDPSLSDYVDASDYDGIDLDVLTSSDEEESFNIHIKNEVSSKRQSSSYRATFIVEGNNANKWTTIRVPFSDFVGYGPACEDVPFDITTLRRLGIVARGNDRNVYLALSRIGFYSVI